nr:hypothetical protein Iba_chr08dCG10440 [Ipomoea batatas]
MFNCSIGDLRVLIGTSSYICFQICNWDFFLYMFPNMQ